MKKEILAIAVLALFGGMPADPISFSFISKAAFGSGLPGTVNLGGLDVLVNSDGTYGWYVHWPWCAGEGWRALAGGEIGLFKGFSIEILSGSYRSLPTLMDTYCSSGAEEEDDQAWVNTSFVPVSMTLKAKVSRGRFAFYAGAGPSSAFLAQSIMTEEYDDGTTVSRWEWTRSYYPGYGYHGVFGVEFRLAKRLSMVFDARVELLTIAARKDTLTAYSEDGVDRLLDSYPNVEDRETEYVRDLADYLNNYPGPEYPRQSLSIWDSASTLGFTVGFTWSFGQGE